MNSEWTETVRSCAASHAGLVAQIDGLEDGDAGRASLLPEWSVGHVLTHIARNADGFVRMVEGAARGVIAEMYGGGREGRAADIEAGASRPAAELVDDVRASAARLDELFATCNDETWAGRGLTLAGEVSISELPVRRRGEVEIHRVDLGLGYTFADWPRELLRSELTTMTGAWASRRPMGLTDLPTVALHLSPPDRLAWLCGRLDVDGLEPAGLF